jgi:hypothetical protein
MMQLGWPNNKMSPHDAYMYVKETGDIEKWRHIICTSSYYAFLFAVNVEKKPYDDTRKACLKYPKMSYQYALRIDQCPREDTRKIACKEPHWAYKYAKDVDKCPRKDTRNTACKEPRSAYRYAIEVDKVPNKYIYKAIKNTEYEEKYKIWEENYWKIFNLETKEEII